MMLWAEENGGNVNLKYPNEDDVELDYGDTAILQGRLSTRSEQQSFGSGRTSRIGTEGWLRENAIKRAQNLKDLEQKELRKRTSECTFQPKINKRPLEKQPTCSTFDRLSSNIQDVYRRREEEKKKLENEIFEGCSFHPKLNQETEEFVRKKRTGDRMEQLGEKLYNDAKEYEKRHREKCRQATEKEMKTLQPTTINKRSSSSSNPPDECISHKPLHERLDDIKKAKANKMKNLTERWSEDIHLTFKPSICARSRSVDHRSPTPEKYDECCVKQPGYVEMAEVQERPMISRRSSQIARHSTDFQQHSDFVERQQWQLRKHKSRIAYKLQEKENTEVYQKPKKSQAEIDRITSKMASRDRAWVTNRRDKLNHLQQESERGFFRPRITKRASSADTRPCNGMQRPTREDFIEKYNEEIREKEAKEHTYRPKIDERSRRLAEKSDRSGKRDLYAKSDEALQAVIRQRQPELKREADECTFHPKTNRPPSPALQRHVSDQSISGFQQFVQRQEYARRCDADRKKREENLHKVKPTALANLQRRPDGRALSTQVEPFKLSSGMVRQEHKEPEHKPRTNEMYRDDVLKVCADFPPQCNQVWPNPMFVLASFRLLYI